MNKFLVILLFCYAVPSWSQEVDYTSYFDSIARSKMEIIISEDSVIYIALPFIEAMEIWSEEAYIRDSIAQARTEKQIEDNKPEKRGWFWVVASIPWISRIITWIKRKL